MARDVIPAACVSGSLILAVFVCAALASPASAQSSTAAARAVQDSAEARGSASTVLSDVALIGAGAAHALTAPLRWGEEDVRAAAGVLVGLAALSAADEAGRTFMRSRQSAARHRAAVQLERFGTVENFYVLGGFYAAGLLLDDVRARSVAAEGLASSLVAGAIITPALQRIVGRTRPRGDRDAHTFHGFSRNIGFPSGHTTHAFAVASVIATEYDHVLVQLAAYGLAAGVAVSRMYHGAHFASDVAAAAVIGTAVGRTVAHYGAARRAGIRIQPALHDEGGALLVLVLPVR